MTINGNSETDFIIVMNFQYKSIKSIKVTNIGMWQSGRGNLVDLLTTKYLTRIVQDMDTSSLCLQYFKTYDIMNI